jgi:hypothetical protein
MAGNNQPPKCGTGAKVTGSNPVPATTLSGQSRPPGRLARLWRQGYLAAGPEPHPTRSQQPRIVRRAGGTRTYCFSAVSRFASRARTHVPSGFLRRMVSV